MSTLFTIHLSHRDIAKKVRRGACGKGRTGFAMRDRTKYVRHNKHKNKIVD